MSITNPIEYYSAMKKNKLMDTQVTWMNLKVIILNERNQQQKSIYRMCPFL